MTSRHASAVVCLFLLWRHAGAGQQKPQAPAFRSETELVTVDVVVADKHGEPVGDLKAEDFVVTEEGRPQRVQFFQPVTTAGQARAARPAERAYRYSTNVGAQAHAGRSFVLFFDDVHLSQEQGERAKSALEQFLNDEAEAGDLVSLVAPARALRWHARLPGRPRGAREGPRVAARQLSAGDQRGARQRLRGLSDPRHAGRADGRAGRAPLQQLPRGRPGSGEPSEGRGPQAREQGRHRRASRAVRSESGRGSLRARHGPESRDARRAQGDDPVDGSRCAAGSRSS